MSVKISELPVLDSLADNDVLAGVDTSANTTSKVTLGSLKQYIDTNTQYTAGTNIDITNNVVSAPNVYNKTETDNLLNAKENISNKVTTLSSSSTNTQYPSAKSVYDHVSGVSNDIMNSVTEATSALQEENEALKEELESVSTIFNAFPVDSDEDESMTLEDTAEVKFKKFDLKGNTYQTQYSGKNLLPPTIATETKNGITLTNNGDGSYTLTGTYSSTTEFSIDLPTTLNGTYSFSGNNPASSNNIQFRILTSSGSPLSTYLNNVNKTFENQTIENGTKQAIRIVGSFTSGFTLKPQLESSSTASSYEPYVGGTASPNPEFPQPVNVVSGDNEIVVNGKNFYKVDNTPQTTKNGITYSIENGTITLNGTATASTDIDLSTTYLLNANTYTISTNVISGSYTGTVGKYVRKKLGSGYSIILDGGGIANTRTISTSESTDMAYSALYIGNGATFSNYKINIQLEKSSSASTYEPYQGNTYNIDLPVENLINRTTCSENQTLTWVDGVLYAGTGSIVSDYINAKANDVFTTNYKQNVFAYDSSKNYIGNLSSGGTLSKTSHSSDSFTTFTLPNDNTIAYIRLSFRSASNTGVDLLSVNLQCEKGSKSNSYTPYGTTPIELCKIGNYQDGFGKSDGRNLVPIEIETETYKGLTITNDGSTFTLSGTPTSSFGRNIATNITLKKGTYTISANSMPSGLYIALDDTSETQLSSSSLSKTFTINQDTTYSALGIWFTKEKAYNTTINLQLEKGSSATEWQPYGVGKWYLHKEIGKYIPSSESSYSIASSSSTRIVYETPTISDIVAYSDGNITPSLISNRFTPVSYNANWKVGNISRWLNRSTIEFIVDTSIATVADFKNWVGNNYTEVYYELATPTNTEITYQPLIDQLNELEKAMSYEGQTNISQVNNDKPFIINAEAILSLKNVLDRVTLLES